MGAMGRTVLLTSIVLPIVLRDVAPSEIIVDEEELGFAHRMEPI